MIIPSGYMFIGYVAYNQWTWALKELNGIIPLLCLDVVDVLFFL
jgi:hypothetical protein